MALRKILTEGDEQLLKHSRKVEKFDDRLHTLIDDMRETLENSGGVGLAAPQVGILRRVVVLLDVNKEPEEMVELVNPEVIEQDVYKRQLLRRANIKTAGLLYLVTSVLGLLLTPRKLIAAAYVLLFGLYPIVKYLIECRLPVFTQLSGKLAYFNIVLVLAAVLVSCGLFPQVQMPGIFRLAGLWIAANIGFIVYDIGLSKVIALLRRTLPPE